MRMVAGMRRGFDLATGTAGLEVVAHLYEKPMRRWPFCTDVFDEARSSSETWRAIGGTATIELSPPGLRADSPSLRRAIIRIVGAELVGPTGARVRQRQPIVLTAIVGFPG